jgi:hypothetical protein
VIQSGQARATLPRASILCRIVTRRGRCR